MDSQLADHVRNDSRPMVQAELMGSHTHLTASGVRVHIWLRNGRFLGRGRFEGRPFGENLGTDLLQATVRLRQILTDLDAGVFVPPANRRKMEISNLRLPRPTLRDIVAEFLAQKRQSRGKQTASDYRARLAPVLDFAEKVENLKRWPLAADIDGDFIRSLRSFLYQYLSSRNGRPGAQTKPLSARQILKIMECLRT